MNPAFPRPTPVRVCACGRWLPGNVAHCPQCRRSNDFAGDLFPRIPYRSDGSLPQCTPLGNCDVLYIMTDHRVLCSTCARVDGGRIKAFGPHEYAEPLYCEVCSHTMKPSLPKDWT